MAQHITSKEFEKVREDMVLQCECGWSGTPEWNQMNLHAEVMDFDCPDCEKMLLIVTLYSDELKDVGMNTDDENKDEKNEADWEFVLKMSGNHIDDSKKVLSDLKKQFPKSYEKKLFKICIDTRKEIDDLDAQRNLSVDNLQHLTNLKYDMEVFISIFRTIHSNPRITEETLFPVEGGQHSDT